MDVIRAGSLLHIVANPKSHFWVVLTDPAGNPPSVVTVMLVTKKKFSDCTVILAPGDCSFITHDTSVNYSTAGHMRIKDLTSAKGSVRCTLRPSLSREVIELIQRGLLESPRTVHAVRDHCVPLFDFDDG